MREEPYQPMLFDDGTDPPCTHLFYTTTNSVVVKVGYTAKSVADRMKRDRQFKGHIEIWEVPCNCTLRIVLGRKRCEREIAWENAHAVDRLPGSEQYRRSDDVYTALLFRARGDIRAMAALDWLNRYGMRVTA